MGQQREGFSMPEKIPCASILVWKGYREKT